jgi:hypothetical protein
LLRKSLSHNPGRSRGCVGVAHCFSEGTTTACVRNLQLPCGRSGAHLSERRAMEASTSTDLAIALEAPASAPTPTVLKFRVRGSFLEGILVTGQLKVLRNSWAAQAVALFKQAQLQDPALLGKVEGPSVVRSHETVTFNPTKPLHTAAGRVSVWVRLKCGRANPGFAPRICPNAGLEIGLAWGELRAWDTGGRLPTASVEVLLSGIGACDHDPTVACSQHSRTARGGFQAGALSSVLYTCQTFSAQLLSVLALALLVSSGITQTNGFQCDQRKVELETLCVQGPGFRRKCFKESSLGARVSEAWDPRSSGQRSWGLSPGHSPPLATSRARTWHGLTLVTVLLILHDRSWHSLTDATQRISQMIA